MGTQPPEVISTYEVLFAVRTGVTILLPETPLLDVEAKAPVSFRISAENPKDILIDADGNAAVLKDLNPDYLEEARERGVIMLYETRDDEVVRCTPCNYKK